MKYSHPAINVEQPTAGHYVITGHAPRSVFIEGEGHICPPHSVHIPPEIPSDLLRAIIADRESVGEAAPVEETAGETVAEKPKRGRKKKEKEQASEESAGETSETGETGANEEEF